RIRTFGSPNTPRTVALARKSANEYPSDRRRCRFLDSAIAQRAKIERTSKLKKAAIHKPFHRYDPSKSPTRFPEDPVNISERRSSLMSISISGSEALTSRRHWKFLPDLTAISSATDQRRSPRRSTARCRFASKQFAVICGNATALLDRSRRQ